MAYTYTAQLKPKGTLHFTIRLGPPVAISDRCTSGKATKSSRSQKDRSGASSDPYGNAIEYMEEAVEDAHKRILRTAVETRDTGAATLLDLEKQRHQMEVTARARLNAPDWVRWLSDWVRWLSDWVRWLSDWVR